MEFWQYIFWASCFLIFYNYAGYALIAYIANLLKKPKKAFISETPGVSFIVAAFNEEDYIEKKIINSLEQDYPRAAIEFIFVTDGSNDNTPEIIRQYPEIQLLHHPDRNGKSAAINRAVTMATKDILIFSDANTLLNKEATAYISRHFSDIQVGGVAGEKKVISSSEKEDEVGAGEGLYWKYESFLKKIDAEFYSVVGAAGELFSLRRTLYEPLPSNVILDDFILSLKVAQKGYRVLYEPGAYAMELPSFSLKDEQKRKVRIAAGGFQSIVMLKSLLLFWRHPRLSFLYISHRVLRWAVTPFCLVLALIANLAILFTNDHYIYKLLFVFQLTFYSIAALAAMLPGKQPKIFKLPYYFTFMNVSVIRGFFRFLRGSQSAVWEKAKRAQPSFITKNSID